MYFSEHIVKSLSLTKVGHPLPQITSAEALKDFAVHSVISSIHSFINERVSSSKVRIVPPIVAVSGITLAAIPAFIVPIVKIA